MHESSCEDLITVQVSTNLSELSLVIQCKKLVYATFKCDVLVIDAIKKNALQEEILSKLTLTEVEETLDDKLAKAIYEDELPNDRMSLNFTRCRHGAQPSLQSRRPVQPMPAGGTRQVINIVSVYHI